MPCYIFMQKNFLFFSYNSRALCTQINKLKLRVETTRYISRKCKTRLVFFFFYSQYQKKNFKAYAMFFCVEEIIANILVFVHDVLRKSLHFSIDLSRIEKILHCSAKYQRIKQEITSKNKS